MKLNVLIEKGMASPYQAVYGDHVKEFPTKQQMLMLVCKNRILPSIKNKWLKHKVFIVIIILI